MNYHRPNKAYPQALLAVYIALRDESQLNGGATMRKLKAAYEGIIGRYPCDRTILRMIDKINDTLSPGRPVIESLTRFNVTKYYLEEDGHVLPRHQRLRSHKTAV